MKGGGGEEHKGAASAVSGTMPNSLGAYSFGTLLLVIVFAASGGQFLFVFPLNICVTSGSVDEPPLKTQESSTLVLARSHENRLQIWQFQPTHMLFEAESCVRLYRPVLHCRP